MNIHIEVNCYDANNVQEWALTIAVYAKKDSQAKEIARKVIDMIPQVS